MAWLHRSFHSRLAALSSKPTAQSSIEPTLRFGLGRGPITARTARKSILASDFRSGYSSLHYGRLVCSANWLLGPRQGHASVLHL